MKKMRGIVSYHTGAYKALSLPEVGSSVDFSDFAEFNTEKKPLVRTAVRLTREKEFLAFQVDCLDPEPEKILAGNTADGKGIWAGDEIEIFLGVQKRDFFQWQFCIGAGGGRFDSMGCYELWKAETSVDSAGWHASFRIPLRLLPLRDAAVSLNVCRQVPHLKEYLSWAPARGAFDQVSNHGILFFCSYDQAFFQLTSAMPSRSLNRSSFEKAVTENSVFALDVVRGPVLIQPAQNRLGVLWCTAGNCAAALDYRKKGEKQWKTVCSGMRNAVLDQRDSCHRVDLTDLEPEAVYEYRLKSFYSIYSEGPALFPAKGALQFTAPGKRSEKLSFLFMSDLHSGTGYLRQWLKLGRDSDFVMNGGDYLACMPCMENFFNGILDHHHELAPQQPLVIVRGNHEHDMPSAADFQFLTFPSGKTYDCFTVGKSCFLILDAGNDHADQESCGIRYSGQLLEEECKWLKDVLKSEMWLKAKYRIAVMHIPPFTSKKYEGAAATRVAKVVSAGKVLPDVMLCGHLHKYGRWGIAPETFEPFADDQFQAGYPVICNSNDSALQVQCISGKIKIKALAPDGTVFDSLTVNVRKK